MASDLVPIDRIEDRILMIRGERVIIDADLSRFYGIPTKRLNEQVRRNRQRFPDDFVFQLTWEEKSEVVANCDHLENLKYSKVLPFAFTEHGAIMAANVVNSPKAIEMGLYVVRAFVKLRRNLANNAELSKRLADLERRMAGQDKQMDSIIRAVRALVERREIPRRRRIGFGR